MNGIYKKLIVSMLEDYSDLLGRKACNNWSFPKDWTHREKAEFCIAYHDWNGDPEEFSPEHLHLPDFAVVDFLVHLLESENDHQ